MTKGEVISEINGDEAVSKRAGRREAVRRSAAREERSRARPRVRTESAREQARARASVPLTPRRETGSKANTSTASSARKSP